jgi:hypothetical protein
MLIFSASAFAQVEVSGSAVQIGGSAAVSTSGVQYNPTTTSYIVTSFSGPYDDGDSNSPALPAVTSVSCVITTGTDCTVNFASAHGLNNTGDAIDMTNLVSWPGGLYQAAQFGSFQVTTVPTSTSLTFHTPRSITYSCASSCGTAYNASYWAIWTFAREPFIYGHGTVYGIETTTQNLNTNFASLTAGLAGTPTILIDMSGVNDIFAGRTVNQIEVDHQGVYAQAHAQSPKWKVMQLTLPPASYGITGHDTQQAQLNLWFWQQTKIPSNTSSGQYIDMYADPATALAVTPNGWNLTMPDPQPSKRFAEVLNSAFSSQDSLTVAAPTTFTYSISSLGGNGIWAEFNGTRKLFFDNSWNQFMDWNPASGTGVSINVPFTLTTLLSSSCLGTNGSGTVITGTCPGFANPMTGVGDAIYGGTAGAATRLASPTTASHLFLYGWTPSGSAIAPSAYDFGANAATWIKGTSPIVVTQNANDATVSCPTCGTGTGGTSVSQNSGSAETNLPITGFMPQTCSDTSGSGTAQICTVANTFTPQTGNCVVYQTTTTNSGAGLTIYVNSLGAKSVAIPGASGFTTTLTAGIIPANKPQLMCYDGTNWNDQQTGTVSAASGYPAAVTLTASNSASLDFTSCISGSYRDYELRFSDVLGASTTQNLFVQVSSNGGSTWDTTSAHYTVGYVQNGVVQSYALTGLSQQTFAGFWLGGYGNSTPGYVSGKATFFNLTSATAAHHGFLIGTGDTNTSPNSTMNWAGYNYNSGSSVAINALRVIAGSGNIASGVVTCQPLP